MLKADKRNDFPSFRAYVLWNLLLILFPIIVFVILFYGTLYDQVLGEVLEMRESTARQMAQVLDGTLESFTSMALSASLDADLTPYQLRKGDYSTMTALRHLRLHTSSLRDVEVLFYIHNYGTLYSAQGSMNAEFFETLYGFTGEYHAGEFWEMLNASSIYGTLPVDVYLQRNNARGNRYFAFTYPWTNNGIPYGTAIGLINVDALTNRLHAFDADENFSWFVLDSQGNVRFSSVDAHELEGAAFEAAIYAEKGQAVSVGGALFYPVIYESSVNGYQYVTLTPRSHIAGLIVNRKTALFLFVLLIVLMCLIFGVLLAVRYYHPVHSLGKMLRPPNANTAGSANIHTLVEDILEDREAKNRVLSQTREILRQELLLHIIDGGGSDDEALRERLRRAGILLEGPAYAAIVLRAEGSASPREREEIHRALYIAGYAAAESQYRGDIVVLLCVSSAEPLCGEVVATLMDKVSGAGHVRMRVGVGGTYLRISGYGRSYLEAVAALENDPVSGIAYFADLRARFSNAPEKQAYQAQLRLTEAIRQGNRQAVDQAILDLQMPLDALAARRDAPRTSFVLNGVVHHLLPALSELEIADFEGRLDELIRCASVSQFLVRLNSLCAEGADSSACRQMAVRKGKMEEVLAYIDAMYLNQDMSLHTVAAHFDMTDTTLSRWFQNGVGVKFVDYLSQKRIERAAELLRQTDLSVREIVVKVGYIDASSFTRTFAKKMGVSPGEYRRQVRDV